MITLLEPNRMHALDEKQLDELQKLFDSTWSAIAKNYLKDDQTDARSRLAKILIDLFDNANVDQVQIGNTAIRLLGEIASGAIQAGCSQDSSP
jgi:hypothetical protein